MNAPVPTPLSGAQVGLDQQVRLAGLGTAVPDHVLPQDLVQKNAARILGPKYPDFERLSKTFSSSGIEQRYSVVPFDWFEEPKNWAERNGAYLDGALDLFVKATEAALADSNVGAEDIDAIVTVSSTGIATPTLESRAMADLGFRHNIRRVPVFGLGCAGGVSGLSIASQLARAQPGSTVLMVAVEACTLSFRADRFTKADIIATVLFGDGAAAAVLKSGGAAGPVLGDGVEHTWPDTLRIMGWDVDPDGFGVVFDRAIPGFAKENLADAVFAAYEASGIAASDIARLVCHPGGAKVLEAIEDAFNLPDGVLDHEREVLKKFGNMSAPTALFVLDEVMRAGAQGQMMVVALGPGFTLSMLPIRL